MTSLYVKETTVVVGTVGEGISKGDGSKRGEQKEIDYICHVKVTIFFELH